MPSPGLRARRSAIATLLFAGLLASAAPGATTTVYRSVDANGNVVFSDRPPAAGKSAEAVEIRDPASFSAPATPAPADADGAWDWDMQAGEQSAEEGPFVYGALTIVSPANDEGVRDNAGNVTIVAAVEPDLRPSHQVEVLLDGQLVATGAGTSVTLTEVDRGTHTVEVRIVDESGAILTTSGPSTFHLLRYAPLLAPNAPKPRPTPRSN